MVALPSLVEFRRVFRVRLTCFHRVCRTINARPRNNNGINHPARCWLQRSIYPPPPPIDEPRDRIERENLLSSRKWKYLVPSGDKSVYRPAFVNIPFPSTAKQLSLFSLPSPREHLPSSLPDLFLVPRKKKKKKKIRAFTCLSLSGMHFTRCA